MITKPLVGGLLALALVVGGGVAAADFADDLELVKSNELELAKAVSKALKKGEALEAVVRTALDGGVEVIELATALMRAQVAEESIRAALLAAGVDPGMIEIAIIVALTELEPAAAGPRGPRSPVPGYVPAALHYGGDIPLGPGGPTASPF